MNSCNCCLGCLSERNPRNWLFGEIAPQTAFSQGTVTKLWLELGLTALEGHESKGSALVVLTKPHKPTTIAPPMTPRQLPIRVHCRNKNGSSYRYTLHAYTCIYMHRLCIPCPSFRLYTRKAEIENKKEQKTRKSLRSAWDEIGPYSPTSAAMQGRDVGASSSQSFTTHKPAVFQCHPGD